MFKKLTNRSYREKKNKDKMRLSNGTDNRFRIAKDKANQFQKSQ